MSPYIGFFSVVNDVANSFLIYDSALTNYQLQEIALRYPLRNSSDSLLTSPDTIGHYADAVRHQKTPTHTSKCHSMSA